MRNRIIVEDNAKLKVPDTPTVCYIEGDGIGPEVTSAGLDVVNQAVAKAYGDFRSIDWMELYAGGKAVEKFGDDNWLPEETLNAIREYKIAIKGPLMTPVGGGIRSLNVVIRQSLDLFACVRPISYFSGVPSPVKNPEFVDMVIFRENTEDIYAGIEWQAGTGEAKQVVEFLQNEMNVSTIRFPDSSSIGIKPISREGTRRIVRAAVEYAIENGRNSITVVHKGNIMKFTEGSFKKWAYELISEEYSDIITTDASVKDKLLLKDCICDAFLQEILINPKGHDVVVTMNLNGDYVSDALAACVGGIGISPGANINYNTGISVFEATHGTAPNIAGKDIANPLSFILSAEMLLRRLGWFEPADLIINAINKTIASGKVTSDFACMMKDSESLTCSEFTKSLIGNL